MAHIETGDQKGSRNIDLNIIPFIDLMSCLTAFLLVTAVWVNISQLNVQPAGKARDADPCMADDCDKPKLSVLVESDKIWVGVSRINEFTEIPKVGNDYDWSKLEQSLKQQKVSAYFTDETRIEIAASSTAAAPVPFQSMIAAMDVAVKTGFIDVGLTEPQSLSARPTL